MRGAARLRANPELFGKVVLGTDPWDAQKDILRALACSRRVAVKACHASGKSFAVAVVVLWWVTTNRDGIAITIAPTWVQVQKVIWDEIRQLLTQARRMNRLILPPANQTELVIGPGNYALGILTDEALRFQDFHAGKVLPSRAWQSRPSIGRREHPQTSNALAQLL
jgi:hypothetical protein